MLKRFYSKRSGFTLVEIIVAFAVFAIMASMIVQILNLSVTARVQNTKYQQELNEQEKRLTQIEKKKDDYDGADGKIAVTLSDGTTVEINYDRLSAMEDAEFDAEGLSYFVSPVDYASSGEGLPVGGSDGSGGNGSGSQASRMDTRITGTGGIADVTMLHVYKDDYKYKKDDPMAIPDGHTRYIIVCAASSGPGLDPTLKAEDVPYSQYRLHFYCCPKDDTEESKKEALDAAKSAVEYTDKSNNTYTKDVYKEAVISKVGYLKKITDWSKIKSSGLTTSDTLSDVDYNNNKYTVEKMGSNVVRIGSPFKTGNDKDGGLDNKGVRFNETSTFYVEFVGDPHITKDSFGANGEPSSVVSGATAYPPCPVYEDEYDTNGKPTYKNDGKTTHVNIYGAYLQQRHYIKK